MSSLDELSASHKTDPDSEDIERFRRRFEQVMPDAGHAATQPPSIGLWELVVGTVAVALWFILFAGGFLIDTAASRAEVGKGLQSEQLLLSWTTVICFWTVTNVGILACLCALLGALGRRTRFALEAAADQGSAEPVEDTKGALVFYYSAVMRGFAIYSLVFAGLFILATEAFTKPQSGDYVRLAATLSVMGFYAGYDPKVFATVLQRVKRLFDSGEIDGSNGKVGRVP
jgi:hypothetical protein